MQIIKAVLINSEIISFEKKNNFAVAWVSFFQIAGSETNLFFTSDLSLSICMDKRFDW